MSVDPRDFLLNTDYELDKVILFKQGQFTTSVDIPHGFDFMPLPFGVWSTDPDFNFANALGATDPGSEPWYQPSLGVGCAADATNIKLTAEGNTNSQTIYYRLYAFEPSDSRSHIPPTSGDANNFILNTDYNYNKLYATGEFTQNNEEFAHNLGYVPQVMAWVYYNNSVLPVEWSSDFTNFKLEVDKDKIKVGTMFFVDKIYWRIYYDEA